MATRVTDDLTVREEATWSPGEAARFGDDPLIGNFVHYAAHSTERSRLTLAKVERDGALIGIAPLLRVIKFRGTRLLDPAMRRWADPLFGLFARKTTCMVDSSFMAFRYDDPFRAAPGEDRAAVREAVVSHLKRSRDVDNVLVSEPAGDPAWNRAHGFLPFLQLPVVEVPLDGIGTYDDYLKSLSGKRRKNLRQERRLFEDAGATHEIHEAPLPEALASELHACLLASAQQNASLEIPFDDLMNSKAAFMTQRQTVIVARVNGALAGFFAFIRHEGLLRQCHGGLAYEHTRAIKAYPNLIHLAVEHAIECGDRGVTLGPLNNEAKRRAGVPKSVMASFWFRDLPSRLMMPKLLRHLQVYTAPVDTGAA